MVSRNPTGWDVALANVVCLNFDSARNVCNADVYTYVSMHESVHAYIHVCVYQVRNNVDLTFVGCQTAL